MDDRTRILAKINICHEVMENYPKDSLMYLNYESGLNELKKELEDYDLNEIEKIGKIPNQYLQYSNLQKNIFLDILNDDFKVILNRFDSYNLEVISEDYDVHTNIQINMFKNPIVVHIDFFQDSYRVCYYNQDDENRNALIERCNNLTEVSTIIDKALNEEK